MKVERKRVHRYCTHEMCAADRRIAASPCERCGEPVGFDTEYVITKDSTEDFVPPTYRHAACVLPENSQFA